MSEAQPKQPFPSWKQALVILCSGIVLGLSSCAVFMVTVSSSDKLSAVFAVGFIVGVVTALVGLLLVLIRAIRGPGPKT